MTTELLTRLNKVRFHRTLKFDGTTHSFCPIWFSDWQPFGVFTWQGVDRDGTTYDLETSYATEPVSVLSSTPALPTSDIDLFFGPPSVRIIHASEFASVGQEISRPSLIVLSDTTVTTQVDSWLQHAVQVYYLIPVQPNLTAERKIELHKRQLLHFKEWMNKAFMFIARIIHKPLFVEDDKKLTAGDFYAVEATINFIEFVF